MEGDDSANREAVREMLTNLVVDHHMKKGNLRIKSSSQLLPMKLLSQRAIYPGAVLQGLASGPPPGLMGSHAP